MGGMDMTDALTTFALPRDGETEDEFMERYRASIPPVVYLPLEVPVADGESTRIELRATRDGRIALVAYSALDRLLDSCGPYQPWAAFNMSDMEDVRGQQPFDLILFDMVMPENLRRTSPPESGDTSGSSAAPATEVGS